MKYFPLTKEEETIGKAIVNAAFKIHVALGPGLPFVYPTKSRLKTCKAALLY
jgi:hypothetical protein